MTVMPKVRRIGQVRAILEQENKQNYFHTSFLPLSGGVGEWSLQGASSASFIISL